MPYITIYVKLILDMTIITKA